MSDPIDSKVRPVADLYACIDAGFRRQQIREHPEEDPLLEPCLAISGQPGVCEDFCYFAAGHTGRHSWQQRRG